MLHELHTDRESPQILYVIIIMKAERLFIMFCGVSVIEDTDSRKQRAGREDRKLFVLNSLTLILSSNFPSSTTEERKKFIFSHCDKSCSVLQ